MISPGPAQRPVSHVESIRLARDIHGLGVRFRSLPGECDHHFHIEIADTCTELGVRQVVVLVSLVARKLSRKLK